MPQSLQNQYRDARARWKILTLYEKFEHGVILVLTLLISIVIVLAVWNLALKILFSIVASRGVDPSDYAVFQALFGMIFTVIIALEFKRSLLVVAERQRSIVQVRTVILLALLAIVRKLIMRCSWSRLRQRSWRLASYIGSSATRIGTSALSPQETRPIKAGSANCSF